MTQIDKRAALEPWNVFVFACKKGLMGIARDAIGYFTSSCPADRLHNLSPTEMNGLPTEHLFELMRLRLDKKVFVNKAEGGRSGHGYVMDAWPVVAQGFMVKDPPVPQGSGASQGFNFGVTAHRNQAQR
jgi:hypothetical protein